MATITAQKTYAMLDNQTLWQTADLVNRVLKDHTVAFAVVGGVAVCLHGYRRNTIDVDVLIHPDNIAVVRQSLLDAGFRWLDDCKEFQSVSGVPVQFVLTGERQGPGQPTSFPNPAETDVVTMIEGLPVLSLCRLIEAKLALGLGDLRRTHKDFADVVELIAINRLDGSFARFLDKSVQGEFRELVKRTGK